jgi:hypothetical protein
MVIALSFDAGAPTGGAAVDADNSGSPPPIAIDCITTPVSVVPRPAEVLVVQDRSAAMADVMATDGATKWSALVSAMDQLVSSTQDATAWGLMLFPKSAGDSNCCQMPSNDNQPQIEVDPATQAALPISVALAQTAPTGIGTPTARALIQAANALAARTTSTSKYLVLVSAGDPTCASDTACSGAATLDYARTKQSVAHIASVQGIPVAVVAVALSSSANQLQRSNTQQLFIDLATAGGMPNTAKGQQAYYAPASTAELTTTLATLQTKMKSCSLAITSTVSYPDSATLQMAGYAVARDASHQDGWDFGDAGKSVVLYGKPCESYRQSPTPPAVQLITSCPTAPLVY